MLIRYGYELTFNCPRPTLMVCLLDAHRERSQELRYEIPPTTSPAIPTRNYLDTFGNIVRRFIAPCGDLTITSDDLVAWRLCEACLDVEAASIMLFE